MSILIQRLATFGILALPSLARAQGIIPPPPDGVARWNGVGNIGSLIYYVLNNIVLPVAGVLAVLFIIIGGFQYIFSGANEELAEKGKKTLTNAVIGLVIVILSYVIVRVVATTLGAR